MGPLTSVWIQLWIFGVPHPDPTADGLGGWRRDVLYKLQPRKSTKQLRRHLPFPLIHSCSVGYTVHWLSEVYCNLERLVASAGEQRLWRPPEFYSCSCQYLRWRVFNLQCCSRKHLRMVALCCRRRCCELRFSAFFVWSSQHLLCNCLRWRWMWWWCKNHLGCHILWSGLCSSKPIQLYNKSNELDLSLSFGCCCCEEKCVKTKKYEGPKIEKQ